MRSNPWKLRCASTTRTRARESGSAPRPTTLPGPGGRGYAGGVTVAHGGRLRRARPAGVGSALALGAGAQTAYVSNLNQTSEPTSATMLAQSFTTGSQPGGYALGSVELSVRNLAGRTVAATIYETDGFGRPTTTVKHALAPPSTFPSDSTLTFTAPAGAILDADTTYSVVFSGSVNVGFERTESNSEDVADTGWSIRDEYTRRLANGAWAHHSSKSLLIAVKGPIPSSDAALADADATAAGFQVDQAPGANVVKVVVTAEDGPTTETYAVTVVRGTTVDLEVPADWSLKPDAVGAGGRFRLPFVSSTVRTPDSTESPTTTPTCRRPPQRATPTSSPSRTSSGRSAAPRTSTSGSRTDPREDDLHHSKASPCRRGRTGRAFGAVVCVVMLGLAFPAAARAPTGDERTALEALYDATDGDNWKRKRRWKSDQNGSWHGVTVRAGNVRKLELAGNKLNGSIPEGIFADLPYLEVVNLADNVLSGAIPADVADLSSLMTLDLSRNGLTGSIPSELGGLSNVTTLNLSRNGLTGSIPTVLGNASSLANLNLAGNGLTGSIPTELGDLPNLIDLRVGDNSLSGTIPTEFTESGDLRELHAQNTGITLPDDADFLTWAAGENRVVTVGTRTASRILELEAPEAGTVGLPIGVWSDGKTIWVAEYGTRNVLAYRLATGARNADKDIRLNINNDEPTGLWSDGTTMWVGDFTWLKLFAYRLSDGTYLPEESVSVDTYGQGLAMWSDGDTWWIGVNSKHTGVRGFEAYSDTRRPEADFPLASTNTYHIGMVSDGTTMWVVDTLDERLYAYSTEDGTHQPFGYQVLDPRNSHPRGAWSDGTTLYVVDSLDRVLYGYSPDATLSALALADGADNAIDLNPAFAPDETAYEAEVVGDRITVLATADDVAATVEYVDANGAAIADQDPVAQGHQMNLVAGANVVRVRVGTADGFASKTYAVSVTSTRPELVTNLGETLDDAALSSVVAQRFTTGSSPYRLHSVTIQLDALGLNTSSGDSHLTVWSESGGEPGTRIARLSSPTLQESGPNTFVVRGDRVFLNPGTDYFFVVNHGLAEDARITLRLTQTTLEMSDFAWRIADTVLHSAEASPTSWDEMAGVLSMRVSGDELRECAVDLEGRTEVWSSTLTVDPIRHLPAYIDSYGFRRDRNAGALSEDDFDFRSAAGVEIDRLSVRTVDGTLVFDESPDLPDADRRALRLHVCVDVFNLADATLETQLGLTTWGDAGLDWSALRTVSVALSEMSSAATLSGLEVADAAGNAIELDDDFAPDIFAYTAMVANAIVRITVTPTADPADATIGYKDGANALLTDADPDADGFQVDLIPGDNVVRVEVTGSADGATTLTYAVTVARGATVDLGTIPADWSLKPDAVGAGETFRLMFVSTTTRTGDSTDIADYNAHVQAAAAAGHADIRPYSADFTAIGSTAAVNARDNTQTGSTHTDAPIYWVHTGRSRGAVADNYADFYDGTWGNTTVRNQSGSSTTLIASTPAITGTDLDGGTSGRLGSGSISVWYLSSGTLVQGSTSPGNQRRMLALSPIFRVAGGASAATLSGLEVADGAGNAIELDDDFAPDIFAYTATVANAIVRVTVTPTAADADATYEIQDGAALSSRTPTRTPTASRWIWFPATTSCRWR